MAGEREVKVVIAGDAKGAISAIDKTDKKLGGLGSSIGTFGKLAAVGFAAVGAGVAAMAVSGIKAASDFNETLSKSNTVFKANAKEVELWANTAAKGFGQSKTSALDAASSFGNMFIQLGIGSDVASKMSMQMTELASDFASFHNADITEVITAQAAAFRGEYDALQRFVPTINAAAVEQEALLMTGKKLTKELTLQEKALATQSLMMKGAGDAMGDFDRTADGLANRQRILSAQWNDMQVAIGQALMPVALALGDVLLNKVFPAIQAVGGAIKGFIGDIAWLVENAGSLADLVPEGESATAWQRLAVAIAEVAIFIRDDLMPALRDFVSYVQSDVIPAVNATALAISERLGPVIREFQATLPAARDDIVGFVKAVQDNFLGLGAITDAAFKGVSAILTYWLAGFEGIFRAAMAAIRGEWGEAWQHLKNMVSTQLGAISDVFESYLAVFKTILGGLAVAARDAMIHVLDAIAGMAGDFYRWGIQLGQNVINGMLDAASAGIGKVTSFLNPLDSPPGWHEMPAKYEEFGWLLGSAIATGTVAGLEEMRGATAELEEQIRLLRIQTNETKLAGGETKALDDAMANLNLQLAIARDRMIPLIEEEKRLAEAAKEAAAEQKKATDIIMKAFEENERKVGEVTAKLADAWIQGGQVAVDAKRAEIMELDRLWAEEVARAEAAGIKLTDANRRTWEQMIADTKKMSNAMFFEIERGRIAFEQSIANAQLAMKDPAAWSIKDDIARADKMISHQQGIADYDISNPLALAIARYNMLNPQTPVSSHHTDPANALLYRSFFDAILQQYGPQIAPYQKTGLTYGERSIIINNYIYGSVITNREIEDAVVGAVTTATARGRL